MKLSDLETAYLGDSAKAGQAADQLAQAQVAYQSASTASTKSTAAFASAITAKGGEASNTATGVTYRSTDSLTIKTSKMVTMDDDAPDPTQAPASPATDPNATTGQ